MEGFEDSQVSRRVQVFLVPGERRCLMKAKTIQIKSVEQGLKDFALAAKVISSGKSIKKQQGAFFATPGAVRKVLTGNRLTLLKAIKQHRPESLYALAKLTGRDLKNVSQDIGFLVKLGLVDLGKPHGVRKQRQPHLLSDHIHLKIAI